MLIETKRLLLPNPSKMIFTNARELVIELKEQMEGEEMISSHGAIRYDHPRGQHNDLLIALELACHAAKPFLERPKPFSIAEHELTTEDERRRENKEWLERMNAPYNEGKSSIRFVINEQ